MNYKRCALRNKFKTEVIKTMSRGLDIEPLSHLFDSETGDGIFLDDAADALEREYEKETGKKVSYDTQTLENILDEAEDVITEDIVKTTVSSVLMEHLVRGNDKLKQQASMKWVNVRGAVEAEYARSNIYELQDEAENITLEAFIYVIIEESEPHIAARKAFTKACKEHDITKDKYENWYEEKE